MDVYISCDPGVKGALCAMTEEGQIAFQDYTEDIPILANWLEGLKDQYTIKMCIIEDVHSIFGTSAKSNFNFGKNVGILHGLIRGLKLPLDLVQPKKWQKDIGCKAKGKDLKKEVASICRRLYPECDIYGPKGGLLDGRADALAIAHYLRKTYTN